MLLETLIERKEDKTLPGRQWALQEVRSLVCSYLHQVFIADTMLCKLVHFQVRTLFASIFLSLFKKCHKCSEWKLHPCRMKYFWLIINKFIEFLSLGLSKRTTRSRYQRSPFNAHMPRLPSRAHAATQFEQADLRHTTTFAFVRAVCPT